MRRLLALAAAAALAACGQESVRDYPVAPADAHRILAETELPPMVFGDLPPAFSVEAEDPASVTWIVLKDRAEALRYVARLTSTREGGTEVRLELTGPTQGRFGNVEARLAAKPAVRRLYLLAMEERIASELERRPFDMSKLYRATVAATVANMHEITASADWAAADDRARARANIEKAYAQEGRGDGY